MLSVYKNLFLELKKKNINYCVYKGLDHFEEDLNGKRGDVDILISPDSLQDFDALVKNLGFNSVKTAITLPRYYVSRDQETGQFVMIDVDIDIRLGYKPYKPISFSPSFEKLIIEDRVIEGTIVAVLGNPDYLALMLLMRIASKSPSQDNLYEIQVLQKKVELSETKSSYFGGLLYEINPEIVESKNISWVDLQKLYKSDILDYIAGGSRQRQFKTFSVLSRGRFKESIRKFKRLLGQPAAFAHDGYMVAFVGVDGAGKSSAIDCVLEDKYFQATGLKRIYFGGNEFMIPGISKLYHWLEGIPNIRGLRAIPSFIMQLDRRARLLKALYYKFMGNIVLCDRYYYDDELSREYVKKRIAEGKGRFILNKIQLFLMPRVLVKPDITFYLDVSPEVAYQRKQDFSYDTMLKVNRDYRDFMSKRKEVTFIDADEEQTKVQYQILKYIKDLSDRKNA